MPIVDPLQRLLSGLENENAALLKSLEAQNERFEAMDASLSALFKLLEAQNERLNTLQKVCDSLSKK